MFRNRTFSSVTINGKTITCAGSNITISNGNVIVDGNVIQSEIRNNAKVIINGDVNKIDCVGSVEVHGNSGEIDCGGSCTVEGDVNGDIDCGGSVNCGNVSGILMLVVVLGVKDDARKQLFHRQNIGGKYM